MMTLLHAGGKFGGSSYAVSGGLHGVGISVVNALSSKVETRVKRQGHEWSIGFGEGGQTLQPLTKGAETAETGTTQLFYPDAEIFESVEFNFETLRSRFQQMAFLNKGLRITLRDERNTEENVVIHDEVIYDGSEEQADGGGEGSDAVITDGEEPEPAEPGDNQQALAETAKGRVVVYQYDDGLLDYVNHLNSAKKAETVHEDVIAFESEDTERGIAAEVAMQWTLSYSESVHTYANTINTHEGGTHEEGFRSALTALINRYAREKGLIREKE